MGELFICGDPRLLSGGSSCDSIDYESAPATAHDAGFTTESTAGRALAVRGSVLNALAAAGQAIHRGRAGYHDTPSYNRFLREGDCPSAGIELETVLRRPDCEFDLAAKADMESNWFHFERDGSLDREHGGKYGYELVTEPLPPRAYRDQRLWTGLQNLCSPWLKSFECDETGLHVHVGLSQFEGFDGIPLPSPADRRAIGKALSVVVYCCLVDQAFLDRVVLRRHSHYCGLSTFPEMATAARLVEAGAATGAALVDFAVASLMGRRVSDWSAHATIARCDIMAGRADRCDSWVASSYLDGGHMVEINSEHSYTVEFRRGKGTLHALSIHRMVELMTGIVRFAGKLCREPETVATRASFMDWLVSTTTSEALRNLAKQVKG